MDCSRPILISLSINCVSFFRFLESDEGANTCPRGGEMLHRADVSDKALGLLMDRCRATFANPEADGGFTLYTYPNRNQVKYRVTAEMYRAAQKCIKSGFSRLRGNIDPVQIDSGIRVWRQFR